MGRSHFFRRTSAITVALLVSSGARAFAQTDAASGEQAPPAEAPVAAPAPGGEPPPLSGPPPAMDPVASPAPPPPAQSAPAFNEPPLPPPSERDARVPSVSLTLSPLHLIFPVFELTAEVRVADHFGVAVIGGVGSMSVDVGGTSEKFSVQEIGAQFAAYPLAEFESLLIGAELLYARVEGEVDNGNVKGVGAGLAVGPMIGYKYVSDGGFTLFVHGGFEYIALTGDASDSSGDSAHEEDSRFIPLLNFNLGWSF